MLGGGSQVVGTLVTVVGVLRHAAGDDVVEGARNAGSMHTGPGWICGQMPGDLLRQTVAGKGLRTGQALVQHTTQRVDIGTGIRFSGFEAFGCHVGQRPHHRTGAGQFGGGAIMGDSEVDQVDELAAGGSGQQCVGRFYVAMDQAAGVRGIQRGCELLDHPNGQLRIHRAAATQHAGHVDAVDDRHHQIQPLVDFPGVENRNDVRFGQLRSGVGLATEPLPIPRLAGQLGGQYLDCHVAVDHGVAGPEHLAHPALADQFEQSVPPEFRLIHRSAPSPHVTVTP